MGASDLQRLLRDQIERGSFRLGDQLPAERVLAEEHGVARGTVREALTRLADAGFVEIRRGSGTYVTHRPIEDTGSVIENARPLELIDARFALEPHICRLCVLHGRREDFELMDELCTRMESSVEDPVAFAEADTAFHRGLASATRNNLLIWLISQINTVRSLDEWTRMRHLTLDRQIIGQYNLQHREILNALRSREPERAAVKMKEHLETARLSLTRAAEA